jgi:hypothetical protein
MAWLPELAEEWCAEFVFGRLVETKETPPRFGFTFSVVLLIIPTSPRVMQCFIALTRLLVSLRARLLGVIGVRAIMTERRLAFRDDANLEGDSSSDVDVAQGRRRDKAIR